MGRILKAYETQFRWLLQQVGARNLDKGVRWLVDRAAQLRVVNQITPADALARTYRELADRCRLERTKVPPKNIHFFCDAGLGGLARWLRASGYEAEWEAGIDDDELLRKAAESNATILTTDSMLLERRVLRDRIIPALWLAPTHQIQEQLTLVFREFGLTVRPPRCMSCGGTLMPVGKETMRERIPPRTYRWLEEYFACTKCSKLFWHGTHWRRIAGKLNAVNQPAKQEAVEE